MLGLKKAAGLQVVELVSVVNGKGVVVSQETERTLEPLPQGVDTTVSDTPTFGFENVVV